MSDGYTYALYKDGSIYGTASSPQYMTELFWDYVELMDMYGKQHVRFDVVKVSGKGELKPHLDEKEE
ncbi:hypothetical protein [Virgibacillus pantothenticus]|uniref:hypothetical protein n=1 Tax=Virgibacillus pantothenticus TaxID=1473 RepID=UPI000985C9EE|nr:hypothetical protein [Virgibacillus pantothenticus]